MSAASTPHAGNTAWRFSCVRNLHSHTVLTSFLAQDIEQVGKDGDTVLLVGPDQRKIQVSSSFLEHISPVFRAMFNSTMSEGEAF
jgi:hypothetical protein